MNNNKNYMNMNNIDNNKIIGGEINMNNNIGMFKSDAFAGIGLGQKPNQGNNNLNNQQSTNNNPFSFI